MEDEVEVVLVPRLIPAARLSALCICKVFRLKIGEDEGKLLNFYAIRFYAILQGRAAPGFRGQGLAAMTLAVKYIMI